MYKAILNETDFFKANGYSMGEKCEMPGVRKLRRRRQRMRVREERK